MRKLITYETLRNYAYSNDTLLSSCIKGIVLEFTGLGGQEMIQEDSAIHQLYAEKGIIFVRPYYNPWCWMNRQTVRFVDEIVDVLIKKYNLTEQTAIVSSGGSMGGLCALVYTHDAKRTPVKCVVNCPVCDLPFHFTERPDLPRTLYSAFGDYDDMTFEEALKTASPLHLAPTMPHIPYTIFHCEKDTQVNIDLHSKKMIESMDDFDIKFYEIKGRDHCDLTEEMSEMYVNSICQAFECPSETVAEKNNGCVIMSKESEISLSLNGE